MAYKLMAVDIDGTLVNDNRELTEKTKTAIQKAVANGLIFTIATGRPISGVEHLIKELDIDLPFITYNGAMVVKGKSREIIYDRKLSAEDARIIIDLGIKSDASVMVWKNNQLYVTRMDMRVDSYKAIGRCEPVLIENIDETVEGGVSKVLWYHDTEAINTLKHTVGQYLSENVNYYTSMPWFLEFNDKSASKAIAIESLCQYYGIDKSETIAVGDGYNDLSMIEYAGLGVAMGNAPDEIKKRADYVTLTNNEDGVAHVIYKFILN
ncbi:MAG: HAD family phosphatase [Clostridiaceae bacterium]|nr:HAD family phosphatase [Clostridiaceae bacterium]